jgi:hypothetical protein
LRVRASFKIFNKGCASRAVDPPPRLLIQQANFLTLLRDGQLAHSTDCDNQQIVIPKTGRRSTTLGLRQAFKNL